MTNQLLEPGSSFSQDELERTAMVRVLLGQLQWATSGCGFTKDCYVYLTLTCVTAYQHFVTCLEQTGFSVS